MFKRESFCLPYGGADLWVACLDSLKDEYEGILEKIKSEEKQICRPSSPSLIFYHLYDTDITFEIAQALVDSFIRSQKFMQKLAIVGISRKGRQNIKKYLSQSGMKLDVAVKYLDDLDEAKDWLVKGK